MVVYYIVGGVVFFSGAVPSQVMDMWQANTPKIIATLELAAFLALTLTCATCVLFYLWTMKGLELREFLCAVMSRPTELC